MLIHFILGEKPGEPLYSGFEPFFLERPFNMSSTNFLVDSSTIFNS